MSEKSSLETTLCDAECPVRLTADIVGHKWTTLVVRELISGKKRYSELLRGISGISPRILADRLKSLESHGVLHRQVFPTTPPTTEYELTLLGRNLEGLIQAMGEFGLAVQASSGALRPASPTVIRKLHDLPVSAGKPVKITLL